MKSASVRVPPSPPAETPRPEASGTDGRVLLLYILQRTSYNYADADTRCSKEGGNDLTDRPQLVSYTVTFVLASKPATFLCAQAKAKHVCYNFPATLSLFFSFKVFSCKNQIRKLQKKYLLPHYETNMTVNFHLMGAILIELKCN